MGRRGQDLGGVSAGARVHGLMGGGAGSAEPHLAREGDRDLPHGLCVPMLL